MKILAKKSHWDDLYRKEYGILNVVSNVGWFQGYYSFALFKIISRFLSPKHKNIIEIGCAPGNYLVKFNRNFGLIPFGVEYSRDGYKQAVKNLQKNNLLGKNVFLADFFDDAFLAKHRSKYDVVFSAGFIEHFDRPEDIVARQMELLKSGGLLVCLIPNVRYVNEFFTDENIVRIHNQVIMDADRFRDVFAKVDGSQVYYCAYFGGLFNVGLLKAKSVFGKVVFYTAFLLQRLLLDSVSKLVFLVAGHDLTCKYTSPSLLCVVQKK